MATTVTLDALHQRIIKELWPGRYPLIETTTGAGSTSSLVIAGAAYSSASVNAYDGVWIYCPSVTTGIKCSKVTRGGLTVASGTLSMSPVYGASPGSGVSAYFLYNLHIKEIDEAINNILRTLYLPRYVALDGLITDGNMEASGVTNWADAVGTPTQTKETSIVFTGKQSLKLVIATSAHAVTCDAVPVDPYEKLYLSSVIHVTAGSLTIQLYDFAADTVLGSTTVNELSDTLVTLPSLSVPANSNRVTARLVAAAASTTAYVDFVQLLSASRNLYAVPTAVNNLADVEGIYALHPKQPSDSSYTYVADRDFQLWSSPDGWRDYPGVNSNLVNVGRPNGYPLFVMFRDTDTTISQNTSDTNTTFVTEELVVQGALANLHQRLYDKTENAFHLQKAREARRIYLGLLDAEDLAKPRTVLRPQRRVPIA